MMLLVVLVLSVVCIANSFSIKRSIIHKKFSTKTQLKMFEFEPNSTTYAGIFFATLIPSLIFVKFVGDQADSSRGSLSEKTKEKFKKAMMEQPGANFSIPSTEEEDLKKQIAKAYMQDKDVDVAVLEEKLRKRAQWRKEIIAQTKAASAATKYDEDGW